MADEEEDEPKRWRRLKAMADKAGDLRRGGIQVSIDSGIKVVGLCISVIIGILIPTILACILMRDSLRDNTTEQKHLNKLIQQHLEQADMEFRDARLERARLDRRVTVIETRIDG